VAGGVLSLTQQRGLYLNTRSLEQQELRKEQDTGHRTTKRRKLVQLPRFGPKDAPLGPTQFGPSRILFLRAFALRYKLYFRAV
jgi:hypothetical protein